MDYKDTLHMPRTDFEMRGNLPKKEPSILKDWEDDDHYHKILAKNEGHEPYILHDGPPYANGNLHAGTGMNRALKDVMVRSHAMNGYYTPFFPGWDTHGLPIENAIQKLGVDRKSIPASEFRKKCDEYAHEQIKTQMQTMKRLGQVADYEHPYITLQKGFEARQIRAFAKMAMDGLIFQGLKPIYWSPYQETAIADSEIVYYDRKDPTIFVAFDVQDPKGVLDGDERFVIWTTTPWTIPADLAISLNPRYEYAVVKTQKGKLIMLLSKVDELLPKFGLENEGILKTFKGQELEYVTVKHPFYPDRPSLVIVGEHVTDEDGTGCVHTAPGHGLDDFYVGQKYGLPAYCPVDEKGCLTKDAGDWLEGKFVLDANKDVTLKLDELGALLHMEWVTHSYPHDERLKKPVIFRATVQWFASVEKIKDKLLDAIKDVKWLNSFGEVRMTNMIKERKDWCISRQRLWGVPIPIIYNEDKSPIMDQKVFDHIADLFEEYGSNVWFERDAKDLLPEGYTDSRSPNGNFTKEKDIMDVWFDSGSSFNELIARDLPYPCDLYFEGSDQYRGWFNSSLIVSVATHGTAPYKAVINHGYVVDDKGEKMSKSQGNVIDPVKVIEEYGADIFRLWCVTVDFKADMRIGKELLKQVSDSYRKIRNTFRFILGVTSDFDPVKDYITYDGLEAIDKYIMIKLDKLNKEVVQAYMDYDFIAAQSAMFNFMTNELSAYYCDFAKDILYIEKEDAKRRRQVQSVLFEALDTLCKLWSPILCFTTDEVFRSYKHREDVKSVHYTHFNEVHDYHDEEQILSAFERLHALRDDVLKALEEARQEGVIGKSLEAHVIMNVSDEDKKLLSDNFKDKIHQWLIVSRFSFSDGDFKSYDVSKVKIEKAQGTVCPRCWNISETTDEDGLCERCHHVIHD